MCGQIPWDVCYANHLIDPQILNINKSGAKYDKTIQRFSKFANRQQSQWELLNIKYCSQTKHI